jgi:hypothetical protein
LGHYGRGFGFAIEGDSGGFAGLSRDWFFALLAAFLLLLLGLLFYSVTASPAGGSLSLRLQRK